MASSHAYLTKLVGQNGAADAQTNKLARFLIQRGAVDNTAVATATQAVVGTSQTASSQLVIDSGVGFNGGQPIVGGRTYRVRAVIPVTAATGLALDLSGGTATATNVVLTYKMYTAAGLACYKTTALATAAGAGVSAVVIAAEIEGTFVATGSGTLIARFAEGASGAGATVAIGAYLSVTEIANGAP